MSKSRGTFITAGFYQQKLNPEWMRYYIAAKLGSRIEDIDLNLQDFIARVNSDLVGKYANIAARASGFIAKRFEGRLKMFHTAPCWHNWRRRAKPSPPITKTATYARALRDIMALADAVNEYCGCQQAGGIRQTRRAGCAPTPSVQRID